MHSKALDSTDRPIIALLAPPQAPLAIEAPHSGAHEGQDYSFCKTALLSLYVDGLVLIICILYHMSIVHSGAI